MWPMHMYGIGWGEMLIIFIVLLLFLAALVAVVIFIGRALSRPDQKAGWSNPEAPGKNAMEILKERYARGEISREEYMRMKEDLEV
jgi:putative membrane protein